MKPYLHANISAKKFGGKPEDYLDIHDMMDSSGMAHADIRHRALFHHSFGCFMMEKIFGTTRVNSDGKTYSVRDVAEAHVIEDLGMIPTVSNYLNNMDIQLWMSGTEKKTRKFRKSRFIPLEKNDGN